MGNCSVSLWEETNPMKIPAPPADARRIGLRACSQVSPWSPRTCTFGVRHGRRCAVAGPGRRTEKQTQRPLAGDDEEPHNIAALQDRGVTVQLDCFGPNEELITKLDAARPMSGYKPSLPARTRSPQCDRGLTVNQLRSNDVIPAAATELDRQPVSPEQAVSGGAHRE
jgi:hypothetical protein